MCVDTGGASAGLDTLRQAVISNCDTSTGFFTVFDLSVPAATYEKTHNTE